MERATPHTNATGCLPGLESVGGQAAGTPGPIDTTAAPRLRSPNRKQMLLEPCELDKLIDPEHQAVTLWEVTGQMDLSKFQDTIAARGSQPGRAATDPRLLIALWLYAFTQGVGSARELERLCSCQDAYKWLCGGVSVNYHGLSDFRVRHAAALDDLFTQVVMRLVQGGQVEVKRVAIDGTRVRASAGSASFRRCSTLTRLKKEARSHLEGLKAQMDPAWTAREAAAQERAAQERARRIDEALAEVPQLQATKDQYGNRQRHAQQKAQEVRVSTTDPQSRKMRMGDGGYRPAYNVQLAQDTVSRAIVAVDVTNAGSDCQQSLPMLEQVQERTGIKPKEQLIDGGYVHLESIEKAGQEGVKTYAPPPEVEGVDPTLPKKNDPEHVAEWRRRMGQEEAKAIYKERAATIETVNADLKTHRGLGPLVVRGIDKVKCVALWAALAYNLMHFGAALLK
jgi:transposase